MIAAADADGLVVAELMSAAWNIYGFESAPETDAQRAVIADADARLIAPGLVTFADTARCTLADTDMSGGPGMDADSPAPADHEGGHRDEHDHAHGDEHDHDHDGDAPGHGDLVVSWTFQCDRPERLGSLDLSGLFAAFERLERVEVQYLDASRAEARTLTPDAAALRLN
ncbi:ZrgA family zinc uptake protein [Maricaulaceae bacterium MS644]